MSGRRRGLGWRVGFGKAKLAGGAHPARARKTLSLGASEVSGGPATLRPLPSKRLPLAPQSFPHTSGKAQALVLQSHRRELSHDLQGRAFTGNHVWSALDPPLEAGGISWVREDLGDEWASMRQRGEQSGLGWREQHVQSPCAASGKGNGIKDGAAPD